MSDLPLILDQHKVTSKHAVRDPKILQKILPFLQDADSATSIYSVTYDGWDCDYTYLSDALLQDSTDDHSCNSVFLVATHALVETDFDGKFSKIIRKHRLQSPEDVEKAEAIRKIHNMMSENGIRKKDL